eukprot:TRINITY_DN5480_c0_g1_i1.p1 TRINITY_DN5480_c0_g1~~TRINITY_DN5480_c0_g1_i1.p1  ORF type:complete len:186 (+),score=7.88 TRINITY_DN5480_c0_g1_i1:44-601(+)
MFFAIYVSAVTASACVPMKKVGDLAFTAYEETSMGVQSLACVGKCPEGIELESATCKRQSHSGGTWKCPKYKLNIETYTVENTRVGCEMCGRNMLLIDSCFLRYSLRKIQIPDSSHKKNKTEAAPPSGSVPLAVVFFTCCCVALFFARMFMKLPLGDVVTQQRCERVYTDSHRRSLSGAVSRVKC